MTADQLALTSRIVGRLISFLVTLAVGVGLSQLIPLRFSEVRNSNIEVPAAKQINRCRR